MAIKFLGKEETVMANCKVIAIAEYSGRFWLFRIFWYNGMDSGLHI